MQRGPICFADTEITFKPVEGLIFEFAQTNWLMIADEAWSNEQLILI